MDFNNPIVGELDYANELSDAGFDADPDEQLEGVAEAIIGRLDALVAMQQQQAQVLAVLAQQMQMIGAARRVVRDETGRVIGSELAQ